ncbi:MAG: protein-L-isoaspartate O-methyltransferase family protein [Haloechinothrix sp.]
MTDLVHKAAVEIDYDHWVTTPSGDPVPQSSNPATIQRMLRLLDLEEDMRVMEIGTGSGYSSALIARAVGTAGRVVSVDVDAALVDRAAQLHTRAGHRNVEVHAADGMAGWPSAAPFDRVVGWTTPHLLPRTWVQQTQPGGIIVTPVKIAEVAGANALVRCRITNGRPTDLSLHPGSFIEMTPDVVTEFGVPRRYVDAVHRTSNGAPVWISARALHDQPQPVADALAANLARAIPESGYLRPEQVASFAAYLLASTLLPASVGTDDGAGFGIATRKSVAAILHDGALLAAGGDEATPDLAALREHWRAWHDPSQPVYQRIAATTSLDDDGWVVRSTIR